VTEPIKITITGLCDPAELERAGYVPKSRFDEAERLNDKLAVLRKEHNDAHESLNQARVSWTECNLRGLEMI
jgi:hypothetical protein